MMCGKGARYIYFRSKRLPQWQCIRNKRTVAAVFVILSGKGAVHFRYTTDRESPLLCRQITSAFRLSWKYGLDNTQRGHQWAQCCHRSVRGIYLFARRANVQQCGGECTCTTHVSSTNENILNSSINTMVRARQYEYICRST